MDKKRDTFFLSNKKGQRSGDDEKQNFQNKNQRHKQFDNNRNGVQKKENDAEKKPFDKKAYRLKKYSKKYKLDQWEEQRKKKMLHEYQKSIKDEPVSGKYIPKSFDNDVPDSSTEVGRFVKHPDLIKENELDNTNKEKKNPFQKAKEQYNKIKQEKLEKKQKIEKSKEERKQKLEEYKKKKHERYKKLSRKNKKGQPVMTGRLELLLDKIQKGT